MLSPPPQMLLLVGVLKQTGLLAPLNNEERH